MSISNSIQNWYRDARTVLDSDSEMGYVPITPAMLFLFGFLILPLLYLTFISFHRFDPSLIVGNELTLENYTKFVFDPFYQRFIFYTIRVSLITTVVCAVLGYPMGHFIARTDPTKRSIFLFLVLLPLMVGTVIRTYGWIRILGTNGILNEFTVAVFGSELVLLGTTEAVIIGMVAVLIPFFVIPVYSSLENMDGSLTLAARDLGANKFQAFYRITLPLSIPGIVSGGIFVFALSMSAVVTPNLLGGRQDVTIGALMYSSAISNTNWPFASAMAVVMTLVTFSLIFAYIKFFSQRGVQG